MTTLRLELSYEIPSQNVWERTNRFTQVRIKKNLAEQISIVFLSECRKAGLNPAIFANLKVTYFSYRKRLIRDEHNFTGGMKAIDDALVRAGIIQDDNAKVFNQGIHKQVRSSGWRGTVVFLEVE